MTEAAKAAILLAILERLFLTRPASWVESNVDYLSTQARAALVRCSANAPLTRRLCQALLFRHAHLSLFQQTRLLFAFQKRVGGD